MASIKEITLQNPMASISTPPQNQEQINSIKQSLLNQYFIDCHHAFDSNFIANLFHLAQHDSHIHQLLIQKHHHILASKQPSAIPFLNHALLAPTQQNALQNKTHQLLQQIISLEITIQSRPLIIHILKQLPEMFDQLSPSKSLQSCLIAFLALQMRSFDFDIRLNSMAALAELGQKGGREWDQTFRSTIPKMIEKQRLVREVSYTKGLFLQMLEDEYHHIRTNCLKCLMVFKDYLREQDLKQIIIYMLNDEHELVREVSLKSMKLLRAMHLSKEDLQTLLMCLRQKRTIMRRQAYQSIALSNINDPSLLPFLIEKMLIALQNYRSDKKHIYRAFLKIGYKYSSSIEKIMPSLGLTDTEQPNFKNLLYKAKMILCYPWWRKQLSKERAEFPKYFVKHMLYICDVESYLFKQTTHPIEEQLESAVDFDKISSRTNCLIKFLDCQSHISQPFHKSVLQLVKQCLTGHKSREQLSSSLQKLRVVYKLDRQEKELLQAANDAFGEQQVHRQKMMQIAKQCIINRQRFQLKDSVVPFNKCTVSRLQPNLIVSSKQKRFTDNVYLRCLRHKILGKERKEVVIWVRELQVCVESEQSYCWSVDLSKYSEIECMLEQRVLDSFDIEQR